MGRGRDRPGRPDLPVGLTGRHLAAGEQAPRRFGAGQAQAGTVDEQRPSPVRADAGITRELPEDVLAAALPQAGRGGHVASGAGIPQRRGHGLLGDADLADDIGQADQADVLHDRPGPEDPAHPPADHAQFLGRGADRDGPRGQARVGRRVHGLMITEDDPFHGGVPDDPGAVPADRTGQGVEVLSGQDGAGRHGRAHQQHGRRLRADGRGQLIRVGGPAEVTRDAGHVPGNPARQPDAVDQAGVDRIADYHFLPGFHRGQQDVENAVQAAGHADALPARVVVVAGHGADVLGRGLAQGAMALERQIAVGRVVADRGPGDVAGHHGRRHVGVEVLQPQEIGIASGIGGVTDLVHADSRDVRQTRDGHKAEPNGRGGARAGHGPRAQPFKRCAAGNRRPGPARAE
jgi:hypothetical protein